MLILSEISIAEMQIMASRGYTCDTQRRVDEKCNFAVMALENSIAGSIIPNYALIDNNNLHIVGEEYLYNQHNLICLKGQSIEDINEVHSHPMALLQCKEFFKKYPNIKLVVSLYVKALQCIGKISYLGSSKLTIPNIPFLISPVYPVPPIRAIFFEKFKIEKLCCRVKSSLGSAMNPGALTTVHSGLKFSSSELVGLKNILQAK